MGVIFEKDLTIVGSIVDADFVRVVLADGSSRIILKSNLGGGGLNEITIGAGDWRYPSLNPAPLDTDTGTFGVMAGNLFDDTVEEKVIKTIVLPPILNSGNVTFEIYGYAVTAAASKNVLFGFEHSAKTSGEDWDSGFALVTSGTKATDSTQDNLDRFTFTETIATLGWSANDHVRIKLLRGSASQNLVGDYGVISFRIILP